MLIVSFHLTAEYARFHYDAGLPKIWVAGANGSLLRHLQGAAPGLGGKAVGALGGHFAFCLGPALEGLRSRISEVESCAIANGNEHCRAQALHTAT